MVESSSTSAMRLGIPDYRKNGVRDEIYATAVANISSLMPFFRHICSSPLRCPSRAVPARAREMRLPNRGRHSGNADMEKRRPGIVDFFELGANAFVTGLVAAVALAMIALALSTAARAATLDGQHTGALLVRPQSASDYAVAPKLETEVAIRVTGMIARTRLTQVFENPGADPVEGIYVFPLPENAAVDHLWLRVGDRVIEGRIQEKETARRTYDQAKREGRKAALMEQQRPNLFTNAIAHIGAQEQVRVTIEYQQTLAYDSGRYRLRFPLAVTPRYIPATLD